MSIKIHHGSPGSYKTAGAIADDFVNAVLEGRHVITNVRGLSSEERVREVVGKHVKEVPESFKLTYIKTDPKDLDFPDSPCLENMEMLRRFWHWSPDNVFFLLDEVQEIWPKSYRESHLRKLDYPGGAEQAAKDSKFETLVLAFEKHRHMNWDFVVTTPHINKVHAVVRESAEAAYKHKNLAILGSLFKGRYIEGFHTADTNGKPSDFYSVIRKKIPSYVFQLYKSTATGVVRDTAAGQSLFKNPKVLGLGLFILLLGSYLFSLGLPAIFRGTPPKVDNPTPIQAPSINQQGSVPNPVSPTTPSGSPLPHPKANPLPNRLSFLEQSEKINLLVGYREFRGKTEINHFVLRFQFPNNRYLDVTDKTFARLGLVVSVLDDCMYEIKYNTIVKYAYCNGLESVQPPPQDEPLVTAYNTLDASNVSNPPVNVVPLQKPK